MGYPTPLLEEHYGQTPREKRTDKLDVITLFCATKAGVSLTGPGGRPRWNLGVAGFSPFGLPYAECSIMPSTRLCRVGSLKESNSLARVTRHNHRVARNAMSLSVGL